MAVLNIVLDTVCFDSESRYAPNGEMTGNVVFGVSKYA